MSDSANTAIRDIAKKMAQQEIKEFAKANNVFPDLRDMGTFTWATFLESVQEKMPLVYGIMCGLMPNKDKIAEEKFKCVYIYFLN